MTRASAWKIAGIAALLIVIGVLPVAVTGSYQLHILIMVLFNITLALGIQLLMTTGLVSFAQAAFWAIGAYTTAILVLKLHTSFWISLPAAGIMGGLVALVVGIFCLRLRGPYFFLITFALGEVLRMTFNIEVRLFGGVSGLSGVPKPDPVNLGFTTLTFTSLTSFYYLLAILAVITFIVVRRMQKMRFGTECRAIRESDGLAQTIGINIMTPKMICFVTGCIFAGLAGAFYASYMAFVSPTFFTLHESIKFLLIAVVGGAGSVWGPVVGAGLLTAAPEFFRAARQADPSIYGGLLVLVLLFLPGGLITLPQRLARIRWVKRLRARLALPHRSLASNSGD